MPANQRCLILAAGFGTRMGPIGKLLPKVMWPVFEMSLLELQIRFARQLGFEEIYINIHHQADEIQRHAKERESFKDVRWLLERPEILDIGGGIHNLATQPEVRYRGELLVLNADQFLWFSSQDLTRWRQQQEAAWDGLLLTWEVNSSQGYNQVTTDAQGRFLGITPNAHLPRDKRMDTYSGNALIKLETLIPQSGSSAFFVSVCPPEKKIMTAKLQHRNYWDFGTAERYLKSMRGILQAVLNNSTDEFVEFLLKEQALIAHKLRPETVSYDCDVNNLIHLGSGLVPTEHPPGIILSGPACGNGQADMLIYQGMTQLLS